MTGALGVAPSRIHFSTHLGATITSYLLESCASLFSAHYGVWGAQAPCVSSSLKPGARVKMTATRLAKQCLADPERTVLVTCVDASNAGAHPLLVGHAFASVWEYDEQTAVAWIIQLVVHTRYRRRYIATSLLQTLRSDPLFARAPPPRIRAVGIASSHPAACAVLAKLAGTTITAIDMSFCRDHAQQIVATSPIEYIRTMQLHGTLFSDKCNTGAVSSTNTSYFIDHEEPERVLEAFKAKGVWPLGELLEGHEFLLILPVQY